MISEIRDDFYFFMFSICSNIFKRNVYVHSINWRGKTIFKNIGYSVKKIEILLFATTWMDLESIMLKEINQRNTNSKLFHSYVGFKKQQQQQQKGGEQKREP